MEHREGSVGCGCPAIGSMPVPVTQINPAPIIDIAARYLTPPEETANERKARLARKRQAVYRANKRLAASGSSGIVGEPILPVQDVQQAVPSTSAGIDIAARYLTPPEETANERKARLARKRQAVYRANKRLAASGSSGIAVVPILPVQDVQQAVPSTSLTTTVVSSDTAVTEHVTSTAVINMPVTSSSAVSVEQQEAPPHLQSYVPNLRQQEADRQRRIITRQGSRFLRVAHGYHEQYNHPEVVHKLPSRVKCNYCTAPKWPGEPPTVCCNSGQIVLPQFAEPPADLRRLFDIPEFMNNIRKYNNALSFTSIGATIKEPVRQDERVGSGGIYNFRIQGALCHRIGALATLPGHVPCYAQLYFYDASSEAQYETMLNARMTFSGILNRDIMAILQRVITENNPLASLLRHAYERMSLRDDLRFRINARVPGIDERRYNLPTAEEVGGIFVCDTANESTRDIVLEHRATGRLRTIFETHQLYDALQYPLLHPYAETGWTYGMKKVARQSGRSSNHNHNDDDGVEHQAEATNAESSSAQISTREYAAYRICWREEDKALLHRGGRLFQQYCVDQYCKMETQRLNYLRNHQAQLRTEAYAGCMDLAGVERTVTDLQPNFPNLPNEGPTVQAGAAIHTITNQATTLDLSRTGTRVILGPSFVGSNRYMQAQYQDAMAIVRALGKPDLFITMTCNPKWPEITENLLPPRQRSPDRPDLIVRVFRLKLKALLNDLSMGALGIEVARIHVVEFQKRGLPHAHILIILAEEDKPQTPQDYDKFVSAELPDPATSPQLYETVRACMMHGPCGAANPASPCMKEGKCSKGFPKPFCVQTRTTDNSYPQYRRLNNGRTVQVQGIELNNQYVVPYNPWLCHKYNCHINVEVCTSISSVKYLYKYVYKGHDRLNALLQMGDEIQAHVDARYISATESCYRIMRFDLQGRTHTVVTLPIHLENQQYVYFRANASIEAVLSRGSYTKLTRFFDLAAHDSFAKTLLYHDVPTYYRYAKPNGNHRQPWHVPGTYQWIRRVRSSGQQKTVIGRMVSCSMVLMERFCLRQLLCYRRGPTSFEDLRTIDGVVCRTFQQAAIMMGLLQDDSEWDRSLQEAVSYRMPTQLRHFFALILSAGMPQSPRTLWDKYAAQLCEDFHRQNRERYTVEDSNVNRLLQDIEHLRALSEIDRYLRGTTPAKDLTCFSDMPQLADFVHVLAHINNEDGNVNEFIIAERAYSVSDLEDTLSTLHMLNEDQRRVYDIITAAIDATTTGANDDTYNGKRFFFLDGPGGTGKSFLLEKILAYTRQQSKIALATASSGIAALLLTGGKTVHSTFKLPLDLNQHSTCTIPVQSKRAELIRQATLIVWDEASMSSRYALEAVDRTLQDITGVKRPFGDKVLLLSGDFRQILPIVPKGTDAQIIQECIKKSTLWPMCTSLRLSVNMRVRTAQNMNRANELQDFATFLLRIGEGRHDTFPGLDPSLAKIPHDMVLPRTVNTTNGIQSLIARVYPDIERYYRDPAFFSDRAILSPLNVDVANINNMVLERITEPEKEYRSVDELVNPEEHAHLQLPSEYLNSLNISGIPVHRLRLKRFATVLLLRNLNSDMGLCNGTRLQIVDMKKNCIHAKILTGKRRGDDVLLPRIYCDSNDKGHPFQIRRKQFPVQVCFAMTINKAQGQSLHHLGLYLPKDVFAHGQLYVALSRVTSRSNVAVLIPNPEHDDDEGVSTKNIVYREVVGEYSPRAG